MVNAKGFIYGFNLISDIQAFKLKLNHIQVVILNLFIINMLADKFQKFEENNPANFLYRFNVYYWANFYDVPLQYFRRNLIALTKPITCFDGTKIQIMVINKRRKVFYIGMHLHIIHQLVNSELFNIQCNRHKKPELCCINKNGENEMPKQIEYDFEETERKFALAGIVRRRNKRVITELYKSKPLFEIEKYTKSILGHSIWAEDVIRKLCKMAEDDDVRLFSNGKWLKVFPHLKNGEFRKNRDGIDKACMLIDDLYSGQFFRQYKRHEIFGTINKEHLQFKNVDTAVDRLLFLIKEKNKEGIERFLYRCARNYFEALKPGMETYYFIKSSFPVNVKSFILHTNRDGSYTVNFLMYYFSTLSEKDKNIDLSKDKIKKTVSGFVYTKLLDYENYLLESQIQSFWLNVNKLIKEIKFIINSEGTSYSMAACFDILFKKVDEISNYHKKVLPGYFDPEQKTASDAIMEMKDK